MRGESSGKRRGGNSQGEHGVRELAGQDACVTFWRRVQAEWRFKVLLLVLLNMSFWPAYLFLAHHAFFPVRTLPLTNLDEWAGFRPGWAWVYESAFLLSGGGPWLLATREELRRYALSFSAMAGMSFAVFVFFPVAAPRPMALTEYPAMLGFTRWDGPLNAFPSLHAACLVYVVMLVRRTFAAALPAAVRAGLVVWGGLILFATLALKQHYAVDLMVGGLLGWLAARWAFGKPGASAAAKARRNKAVTSQGG
jgi:membrane-associated phospholipid phosphatase